MSEKVQKDWKKFKEDNVNYDEVKNNLAQEEDDDGSSSGDVGSVGLDHPSYRALEEKLTLAEQQAHENWEKSVRALAELDNVRRRAERDIANAHRFSLEKFSSSLLPVMDSLEQALQLAEKAGDTSMQEGLELTMKQFLSVLEKFDVQQLNPLGDAFNPHEHEAMAMQPSPDVEPNTVLVVFQKGYKLYDRVIRPARVIVAS